MTAGIISATLLITATTIDDAVWLIPYCTSPHLSTTTKAIHAITFIITLESLAIISVGIAKVFKSYLLTQFSSDSDTSDNVDFILGLAGAIICWVIAIVLFVKKMLKRRRRAMAAKKAEYESADELVNGDIALDGENSALIAGDDVENVENASGDEGSDHGAHFNRNSSIWLIVSLTTLGALDEISYFPALLVGHVFTAKELCIGTLFASGTILAIVLLFLSKFKPLVDCLDRIPLYGIVGMFAIILTAGLFIR